MGTWGLGPFENDGALDFLAEAEGAPIPSVQAVLERAVASADYLDVDDGQAALAACELVALGFGYAKTDGVAKQFVRFAARLGPNENLRELALAVLPRIARRKTSELADLWHEGDGDEFDALIADLVTRLESAGD